MPKNVFVVGFDEFNAGLLQTVTDADRYRFYPLLDATEIVNPIDCRVSEVLLSAKRTLDSFDGPIDAIIGYWDFPTSTILPILRKHCGLPGPSLETVLQCEHKYWSRVQQQKVIAEHVPRFCAFDPFADNAREQIDLDYPFWIKPIKAHSSYLGFRIDDAADFSHAVKEIRKKIQIMAYPFDEIMDRACLPLEIEKIDGWHCIAEEIISANIQCTLEGYVLDGQLVPYGFVDSERAGRHSSSFVRYHYPSQLPAAVRARMVDVAETFLRSIGYDQSPFNIEFFYDEASGRLSLVEINARISKSHCPLFFLVDGASHQQVALSVALGEDPKFPYRRGHFPHAAKFMMRHLGTDALVEHAPQPQEIDGLGDRFPDLMVNVHVRQGCRLSDLALQEPYSYELADIFLGGKSIDDLQQRYDCLRAVMPFMLRPLA